MVTFQDDRGATPGVPVEMVKALLQDLGSPLIAAQGFLALLGRAPSEDCAVRYREGLRASLDSMSELVERARAVCLESTPQ